MHYSVKVITLCVALLFSGAAEVQAQARSGNGGINVSNLVESNCVSDVRRLEVLVEELETFARELEACNDSGQVFDGVNCANIAQLDAVWDNPAAPSLLRLMDNGNVIQRIPVNRGIDGTPGVCPNQPSPSPPPPPPATPNDCRAPWGANVAHGSDVEAFETASVPNGQTCNSEMRLCTDGRLEGSFTNQSCAVEPPPPPPDPEPEPPQCVWAGGMPYATAPNIMRSVRGDCGAVEPTPCSGCTSFRAYSDCEAGASCNPDDPIQYCLKNERTCNMGGGQTATQWDRYICSCDGRIRFR